MGAWGSKPFENDDAADWVWELEGSRGDDVVLGTLENAAEARPDVYLDLGDGATAVAAATIVAARLDGGATDLPPEAQTYLARVGPPDPPLVQLALAALDRVTGPASELEVLWTESASAADWRREIAAIRDRLARGT